MPMMAMSDGCSLHYRFDGEEGRPVVMLSNSLGSTLEMWDPQIASLTERFRVLRYDNRGHGASEVSDTPYTVTRIGRDAQEMIEQLNLGEINFCGLSLGGMAGMWLGANAPFCVKRLVLANTSAYFGNPALWNERIEKVQDEGMEAIVRPVIDRWMTQEFIAENPALTAKLLSMIAGISPIGYVRTAAAVRDVDLRADLAQIRKPTLIIAGARDPATPVEMSEEIAEGIPNARLAILEALHLSNIEKADEFNTLLRDFFAGE